MSYTVNDEFIIERDGAAVHYTDIGSTVELSEEEAATLIDAGKVSPPATATVDVGEGGSAGSGGAESEPISKAAREAANRVADKLAEAGKAGKAG